MVNIAVLGYGTVGSGVVEVINTNHNSINKRAGAEINIKYVLDLRDFPGDPVEKVLHLCKTCPRIRQKRLHLQQSPGSQTRPGTYGDRMREKHQLPV